MSTHQYSATIDGARITQEIANSTISIALDYINTDTTEATFVFKAELSPAEVDVLADIVSNHVPEPLPEDEVPVVEIYQGKSGTNGSYRASGKKFIISAGSANEAQVFTWSWPVPIRLFTASWVEMPEHSEAEICVDVAPDTIIGTLSGPTTAEDPWLDVAEGVLSYVLLGYHLALFDGVSTYEHLGQVVEIDLEGHRVKVETPPSQVWPVGSPTTRTICLAENLVLSGSGAPRKIGGGKVGGSLIPANTPLRLTYTRGVANTEDLYLGVQFEIDY